jgi:hypothetical protein
LLRKVPNYDIQIGVRHCWFPQVPSDIPYNRLCNC